MGTPKRKATMSLKDLVGLFPAYDPSGHVPSRATQKGFKHKHNPTWKPGKQKQSPAEWGRQRRKARLEAEKK